GRLVRGRQRGDAPPRPPVGAVVQARRRPAGRDPGRALAHRAVLPPGGRAAAGAVRRGGADGAGRVLGRPDDLALEPLARPAGPGAGAARPAPAADLGAGAVSPEVALRRRRPPAGPRGGLVGRGAGRAAAGGRRRGAARAGAAAAGGAWGAARGA